MFTTRTRTGRAAFATIALASAVGMSACQSDAKVTEAPSAAAPTASASQAAPTSDAPTSDAPATESSTSDSSSSDSSTSSDSSSSSSDSSTQDATLTPKGTKLKFGQSAVVREGSSAGDDTYKLTAKSLDVAPDSLYASEPSLKKANGPVYFLRYEVTNLGKAGATFSADDVNGFMFTPKLAAGQKGKKFSGDVAGCKTDDTELKVGESGQGCAIYQAGGAKITDAIFAPGLTLQITWTP